jgi:hypothetical protein
MLVEDGWWLWSVETQREVMRLLVLQGQGIPTDVGARLEAGIIAGPPRRMFCDDIEPERWQESVDHAVWLRLAKLASGGRILGNEATVKLTELSLAHPKWKLAANEGDEFSHWISVTRDPDYEDQWEIDRAPRRRRELVAWLKRPPPQHPFSEDGWHQVCRERFWTAAWSLCTLARENVWPAERWRDALEAWNEEKLLRRSWRFVVPLLQRMPDAVLLGIFPSATGWLEAASKVLDSHESPFLDLCRRFLGVARQDGVTDDRPVTRAINHPLGHVTNALIHYWFRSQPNDGQGLPEDLKSLFTALCDTKVDRYRHARVLLAARVIALFRVDPDWTKNHLLPLFNWQQNPYEARAAWEGFLWSPRLYQPLLAAFKADFLETARHYANLAEHRRQYAAILTYAALDHAETFNSTDLYEATAALPQEGLQEAVQALVQGLEGAGEQREQYWSNRIQPYWQTIWPKSSKMVSGTIAERLVHLAIAARGAFSMALAIVRGWLRPVEHPYFVVHLLHESGLCTRFHNDALTLLDLIIGDQPGAQREVYKCLIAISEVWPDATQDGRYKRLMEYARKGGPE